MHYISTFKKEEVMKYYNVLEAKNALSNKRKPRVSLTASFIHEAFRPDLDPDHNWKNWVHRIRNSDPTRPT